MDRVRSSFVRGPLDGLTVEYPGPAPSALREVPMHPGFVYRLHHCDHDGRTVYDWQRVR